MSSCKKSRSVFSWIKNPPAFQCPEGPLYEHGAGQPFNHRIAHLCDSSQWKDPSQESVTPLLAELMASRQLDAACNWNIQEKSALLQPPAPALMYVCPLLSLGAHGSYLSLSGSSGTQRSHTSPLLDYPHRVSLWPLSSCDDTGLSSQGADLTHSPQSTATSHMSASPVMPTQC